MKKKSVKKCIVSMFSVLCVCGGLLTGCGENQSISAELAGQLQEVESITVPENVKIVGLGEATHGNSELQTLKKDVFQAMVEQEDCRIFAIEGDFGGSAKVNEYIAGGDGTAEEAAAEIGFAIYRTEEMADLIEWMREYNSTAVAEEQLKFYGFDMQRYDNSKEYLFRYLEQVDGALAEEYKPLLADLNDDTVYSQDQQKVTAALSYVEKLMNTMDSSKESYIGMTGESEYQFALQCAQCIKENATLQSAGTGYSQLRDEYMKNKVDWILEHEGNQMIFITGHSGHIEKTSASGYTSMGNRLSEAYGDAYFAIGTDILETQVNVTTSNGEDMVISLNNENSLTVQFKEVEENISYLDMTQVPKDSELGHIISRKNQMLSVGAEFNSWQKSLKQFYTLKMIPNEAYDGLIVIKSAVPTVRVP